jgi:hypothetical protein
MNYQLSILVKQLALQYLTTNVEILLEQKAEILQTYVFDIALLYSSLFSIETAYGIWLDFVGYRIGIFNRPVLQQGELLFTPFGFDVPEFFNFDNAPFGDDARDNGGALDDDNFRKFLCVKARQLITDCTEKSMQEDLSLFFDTVNVFDNQNMSFTVTATTTESKDVIQAVLKAGIIYQPAGVLVEIRVNPTNLGMTFDHDPFDFKPFSSDSIYQ